MSLFKANVVPPDAKQRPTDDEPLPTDGDDDIHSVLRKLRLDEVAGLSQSSTNRRNVKYNAAGNYISLVFLETGRYIRYVCSTWTSVTVSILFGGLGIFDTFSLLFFAAGGTVLLLFVLIFCLAAHFPVLIRFYFYVSDKYFDGLGLVNFGNPHLFKALTQDQAAAAKKALGVDIKKQKDGPTARYFDFDIAKLMLQLASVIYEHENDAIRTAVGLTADEEPSTYAPQLSSVVDHLTTNLSPTKHRPGKLLADLFGQQKSNEVANALDSDGDRRIREFSGKFGLDFEPLSELNNTSSAFAGCFWDPNSNWIIISFKGTGPIEFGEWLSDFNAFLVPVGTSINRFSKVHKGFKERVFPTNVSSMGNFRPYDTILAGVKALAKWLRKRNNIGDDTKINLWFTGHSLGCATASLVYTRMVMNDQDLPKRVELRNAYLFAAPIICDRPSVEAFNNKMVENPKKMKTMWRITSNGDAVATCLPELGDYTSINVSPNNGFAFAHLGTEIKIRDDPYSSHVAGNHITYGTVVYLDSSFTKDEIAKQRVEHLSQPGEARRERAGILVQKIPIIGRFAAHCTIFYWDQLDRVAIGKCEWVIN